MLTKILSKTFICTLEVLSLNSLSPDIANSKRRRGDANVKKHRG